MKRREVDYRQQPGWKSTRYEMAWGDGETALGEHKAGPRVGRTQLVMLRRDVWFEHG